MATSFGEEAGEAGGVVSTQGEKPASKWLTGQPLQSRIQSWKLAAHLKSPLCALG